MIWPFSHHKTKMQDVVQAEKARKRDEAIRAAKTEALQKALQKAMAELGPVKEVKDRD